MPALRLRLGKEQQHGSGQPNTQKLPTVACIHPRPAAAEQGETRAGWYRTHVIRPVSLDGPTARGGNAFGAWALGAAEGLFLVSWCNVFGASTANNRP